MKLLIDAILTIFESIPKSTSSKKDNEELARKEFILGESKKASEIKKKIKNAHSYFFFGNRLKSDQDSLSKACCNDFLYNWSLNQNIKYLNLIFLLQNKVVQLEITPSMAKSISRNTDLTLADYVLFYKLRLSIGQSIATSKQLKEWKNRKIPIQIFLSARSKGDDDDDSCKHFIPHAGESRINRIEMFKEAIDNNGLPIFIHASFTHNLCNRAKNCEKEFSSLLADLRDGNTIGAKGVVVHVGKNTLDLPYRIAVERMRMNVISILEIIDPNTRTPLLIETPAAQGQKDSPTAGEVLSDIEGMINFYLSIPDNLKGRLGICVDTCHVFAAGYNPLSYIEYMECRIPGVIKFIHFNDSVNGRYCKVDRHFHPGGGFQCVKKIVETGILPKIGPGGECGHIGLKRLTMVAQWCQDHKIPMVTE